MGLESLGGSSKFVIDLNIANPTGTDVKNQGDDHIRGIKNVLKNTFPGFSTSFSFADAKFIRGMGAKAVSNKLIGGNSNSQAAPVSCGVGLSMNASAGYLRLALDNITSEQSVGATINFGTQVIKQTRVKGGYEFATSINASGTVVIDFQAAHFYHVVINDCCTFALSNVPAAGLATGATILMQQGSSGAAVSHAQSVNWADGVAPTMSPSVGEKDIVVYTAYGLGAGSTTWVFGFTGGQDMQPE